MSRQRGLLFIVVGPPGVGKNTLMNDALEHFPQLRQLATATTRPRRPTEREGREHLFVTLPDFQQMVANNQFLEWQEVHPGKYYGVPRAAIETLLNEGNICIADIDVLGATYIRSAFPQNVALIFVAPPSTESLRERLENRQEKDIEDRMKRVSMELSFAPLADYVIVNDDLEAATQAFKAIIAAEIQRVEAEYPPQWHYRYEVTVIPTHGTQALIRTTTPRFPTVPVAEATIPHHTAQHAITETLNIPITENMLLRRKPNAGSFISPVEVGVTEENGLRTVTFTYGCRLAHHIEAPEGWEWQPLADLPLPQEVIRRLETYQQSPLQEAS